MPVRIRLFRKLQREVRDFTPQSAVCATGRPNKYLAVADARFPERGDAQSSGWAIPTSQLFNHGAHHDYARSQAGTPPRE